MPIILDATPQKSRAYDFLVFEEDHLHSRENFTLINASNAAWGIPEDGYLVIKAGTVVAKLTSSGAVIPYVPGGSLGAELFFGVVVEEISPVDFDGVGEPPYDNRGAVICRNATFKVQGLKFVGLPAGPTNAQWKTLEADMNAKGCALRYVVGVPTLYIPQL